MTKTTPEKVGAPDRGRAIPAREHPQTTEEPFGAGLFAGPERAENTAVSEHTELPAGPSDEDTAEIVHLPSVPGSRSEVPAVGTLEDRAAEDPPSSQENSPQETSSQETSSQETSASGSARSVRRQGPGTPVRSTNRLRRARRTASPSAASPPSAGREAEAGGSPERGASVFATTVDPGGIVQDSIDSDPVAVDTVLPGTIDPDEAEFIGTSPGETAESETPAAGKGRRRRRGGAKRRSNVEERADERGPSAAADRKEPRKAAVDRSEKPLKKALPTADAAAPPRRRPRKRRSRDDGFSERSELIPAGAGVDPSTEEVGQGEVESDTAASTSRSRGGAAAKRASPQRRVQKAYHRILINADDSEEVRIAVLEDGQLEELYYERPNEKKYLGNIYKGRVMNLEPGIQAAFVDIGIGRNGFLHVSDVLPAYKDSGSIPMDSLSVRLADRRRLRIQEVLRKGQEILVQISKDAIGAKGPSLTTYVSVPGKYLVLMPGVSRHGVSKRIQDDDERSNLRDKLSKLNPPKGMGFIIRTAGQQLVQADLERDFQYLMTVWEKIYGRVKDPSMPSMIYAETDLVIRTLRDLSGPDVNEILIDDLPVHERSKKFLDEIMHEGGKRVKRYTGAVPIFSKFGVEDEIEKIYNRRVPLPNGGHIVLEQTEALVAIDVNSGKYRDEEDLEATALKTNLEAAQEIARQLRLRDLGGVIVNDFIDMESEANRRAVERALRLALKRDRAKSWITEISRFGIIEMTRQRVRPSFERANHEPCKACSGTGVVKSARSTGITILRQIRAGVATKRRNLCEVLAPPSVVDYLLNERRHHLVELENNFNKTIIIKTCDDDTQDQFSIKYR